MSAPAPKAPSTVGAHVSSTLQVPFAGMSDVGAHVPPVRETPAPVTETVGAVAAPEFVTVTLNEEVEPTDAVGNSPELKVIGPAGRYVNAEFSEPDKAFPVPIGGTTTRFVTVTPTGPLPSPIGVRTVMVRESITTTSVAGLPMLTVAPAANPVPVIVTS